MGYGMFPGEQEIKKIASNWFGEGDDYSSLESIILAIGCYSPVVWWIVTVIISLIDKGFWRTILPAIGTGIIAYIAFWVCGIAAYILIMILRGFFRLPVAVRWILLLIIIGLICYCYIPKIKDFFHSYEKPRVETPQPSINYYYCNNTNVNIRERPDKNSRSLGRLQINDKVNVLSYTNDFAKIEYNGKTGYVYDIYLQNKPVSASTAVQSTSQTTMSQSSNNTALEKQNLAAAKNAFNAGKYDEALSYYKKAGEEGKAAGYKAFRDKAKELIGILGECDEVARKLLRHAQNLDNTQEISNLINSCNQ